MAARGRKTADSALLIALAGGLTIEAAAEKANVSERTARRRLADPEFRKQFNRCRSDMLNQGLGLLAQGVVHSAVILRSLLNSKSEKVKLSAARAIIELGLRMREAIEVEQRLSDLEEKVAGIK